MFACLHVKMSACQQNRCLVAQRNTSKYRILGRLERRMNVRKQATRLEHAESASNGIESAFTTMVQRWLVKGSNGKWQLPVITSKRQANGIKLPSASRKRQPEQSKRPTKKLKSDSIKDTHVEAVSALHIHHKLAMDFLERSKTCTRAGAKPKALETIGSHPSASRQHQRAAADVPCSTTCKDERPRSSGTDVKEEHARVECASSIQAKTSKRTRVLVLNRKVSPLSRGNSTNARSDECSAPPPKCERRFKNPRSQPASDSPKAKAEVAVESGQIARTKHSPADGIPMLCNGQRKCKKEGCYKAAYQRGLCPAHGGRNKCRAEGCKNYAYAQGLCQAHGAGKPHAVGNSTAERAAGEIKTSAVKLPPKLVQVVDHDDSSDGSSSASSAKTTSRNTALESEESTSRSTTKSQLKLQTAQKGVTPAASDAWRSSDLPKLFRSASCKASAKPEKVDYASLEEKPSISQPPIALTSSLNGKANASMCKVRGCKQSVASEGFCQTHVQRKRCREEGCTNLAVKGSGGLCSCHARRKACAEDGCTKKARLRGRCSEHGGKYFCREEGCGKTAYLRGLCGMHLRESQDLAAKQPKRL